MYWLGLLIMYVFNNALMDFIHQPKINLVFLYVIMAHMEKMIQMNVYNLVR